MQLTERDVGRLVGVHEDLIMLVEACAVNPVIDFMVLEGIRSVEQQAENVAKQVSWTMNSRHLTGHAVDLVPLVNGDPTWDWQYYHPWAEFVKEMAEVLGIDVDWGGDWESTPDGPHWELNWNTYPLEPEVVEV